MPGSILISTEYIYNIIVILRLEFCLGDLPGCNMIPVTTDYIVNEDLCCKRDRECSCDFALGHLRRMKGREGPLSGMAQISLFWLHGLQLITN